MSDFEAPELPADIPDPDAPYGRRKDGTPKAKPGPGPGRAGGNATPRAPGRRTSTRRPAKAAPKTDYRTGVRGILQLVSTPLVLAGQRNPVLLADGAAVTLHADNIAAGAEYAANEDPRFAAILDKVLVAGPYGALLTAVLGLGAQIATNHGAVPPAVSRALGAMPPEVLLTAMAGSTPMPAPEPEPVSRETPSPNGTAPAAAPEHDAVI